MKKLVEKYTQLNEELENLSIEELRRTPEMCKYFLELKNQIKTSLKHYVKLEKDLENLSIEELKQIPEDCEQFLELESRIKETGLGI